MKKVFWALSLSFLIITSAFAPATANPFAAKKATIIKNYELKSAKKAVLKIINLQSKYSTKYDYSKLSSLYYQDFKSSDGFNKDIYFKLIKDTWESYPDITYTTKIKDVRIENNEAQVDVYETSVATSTQIAADIKAHGELTSTSNGTYYLKKINNNWFFVSEKIDSEKSFLKYGDTRFIKMDLASPQEIKSGEYYTSSLSIEPPKNSIIVASIGRDTISYPQSKSEEVFRKVPTDNILERMFLSNKDGKNEYNVASIGLTKAEAASTEQIKLYLTGIAFIMTRVNVEEMNAKKD